uniref:MFS domain-containing protein n=1 Tax=Trichobilharzia regenti TaxID=157069 RepID=A0AA85JCD9_TRIRE|nr:unnamed protein product [Trichobilharzia regenti]
MSVNSLPNCESSNHSYSKREIRVLCILIATLIPFYTAVEISTFICDQYTFYSFLTERGLPYGYELPIDTNKSVNEEIKLKRQEAQSQTSIVQSSNNFAAVAPGLVSTLLVGYLSDRFGRKVALGIIIAGEAAQLVAVAVVVFCRLTPWALVISNVIEGFIGGGLLSAIAQFSVCIADLTNLLKSSSCCMIAGPLIYNYGFETTMAVCIIVYIPVVLLICILPETNSKLQPSYLCITDTSNTSMKTEKRKETETSSCCDKFQWKIKQILRAVMSSHPVLIIILMIQLLVSISAMVDSPFSTVYLMSEPFWWNPRRLGLTNGIVDTCSSVLSIAAVNILVRYQKSAMAKQSKPVNTNDDSHGIDRQNDRVNLRFRRTLFGLLIAALILMLTNRILMTVAFLPSSSTANMIVYIALIAKLAKNINFPLLRTLVTNWSSTQRQGLILSFASFISRIGLLISVSALPLVYSATLSYFPGAVFLICASLLLVALCASISLFFVAKHQRLNSNAVNRDVNFVNNKI